MTYDATPNTSHVGSLAGHLLVATPALQDTCFTRSVVYMCSHDSEGAMGIIINYPVGNIHLKEILEQLDIAAKMKLPELPVHFGGPVESNRGFVMHSSEGRSEEYIVQRDGIVVTASVGVLQEFAQGRGPAKGMLMLGYAGWSPGQLEAEIESGSWINVPATTQLVFDTPNESKWSVAISSLGFDLGHYSNVVGHA